MTIFNRREIVATSAAALFMAGTARADARTGAMGRDAPFSWDWLIARAQALSSTPYRNVTPHPRAAQVDYDALNKVRFREDRTIWGDRGDATGIRLFPLSQHAAQPIFLTLVENGRARPLSYSADYFDMPADSPLHALGPDAGFAGFRVMNAARDADWLVFMGASYFRAAGAQKQYGLSARAIAIDTSVGQEEFPRFTHFWLEHGGDGVLTVHALLDGPSIAGAYRFRNRIDGTGVHQDIDAALFPRRPIRELGLMPMTSMFWYDQTERGRASDWRPEVHDSDGLLIRSADGAADFRPLANPMAPRASFFAQQNPQGFGLIQRDRNFDHYQDDGVFYDRRPSLWATPRAPLGSGHVRLYEFPTQSEYDDNVACYWTARDPVVPGKRIDCAYRLDWQADAPPPRTALASVADIWRGASDTGLPHSDPPIVDPARVRLVVDFADVPPDAGAVTLWAETVQATLMKQALYPVIGRRNLWRAVLDMRLTGPAQADVRAQLQVAGTAISEMVHYPVLSSGESA